MFKQLFLLTFVIILVNACEGVNDKQENTEQNSEPTVNTASDKAEDHTSTNEEIIVDESKTVVAMVNGKPLYKEDLSGLSLPKAVENEILYQEAVRKGYEDKYSKNVENFKRSLFINQLKSSVIKDYLRDNPVKEEELTEFVKDKLDNYIYLKVVKVTTEDADLAQKIADKAKSNNDLKQSAATIAGNDANIVDENFSKNYNEYFKEKNEGDISDVISSGEEYIIIQIVEKKELPTEQIARTERFNLVAKKKREAVLYYLNSLKKEKYEVKILK